MNVDKIVDKVIKAEQDKNGPLYLTPTVHRLMREIARDSFTAGKDYALNKLDLTWEQE